jgi:hypothetical protein
MKNQGSRISALLIAGLAVAAFGCSSGGNGSGTGGSGSGTGGGSGSGGSSGANEKVLTPNDTGYVMDADTGIMGAWYIYGDNIGSNGSPPGDCQAKGMHADSECSTIMYAATATVAQGFPQDTPGKMCIKGTGAKVINMGTAADYSNIFGIGMGLDFNNDGSAKNTFDLTAKKITAFKFTLSGVPLGGGLRIEFPTTETEAAGHDSYYASKATKDGDFTVSMAPDSATTTGPTNGDLAPSFTQSGTTMQPDFNPAHVLGVQVHVSTNVTNAIDVSNLCISNLTAVITP